MQKPRNFDDFPKHFRGGARRSKKPTLFGCPVATRPGSAKKWSIVTKILTRAIGLPEAMFFFRFLGTPGTGLLEQVLGMLAKQAIRRKTWAMGIYGSRMGIHFVMGKMDLGHLWVSLGSRLGT